MKSLKLFNAVIAKDGNSDVHLSQDGYIIDPAAMWAKDSIVSYFKQELLNGNDLNKTFHKSWAKIKNSSRFELYLHQIHHYLSTYGSDFKDDIYIPTEVLDIPDTKLIFKVVNAYTKEELTEKCLHLLRSGVALKRETINDLLSLLTEELDYTFTGHENIRNKEAIVKIADIHQIYPADVLEFLRFIIYKTTDQTLLIKSDDLIAAIKGSDYDPTIPFNEFGVAKLAQVFNRFKPLFLAYKSKCGSTINRISKLSKKYHKPLVSNPLNLVTSLLLKEEDTHWLDNATPFALFRALSACWSRMSGQSIFTYRIRNGKSWVKKGKVDHDVCSLNYMHILDYLKSRIDMKGKTFYMPEGVYYALPTSEKLFVGNIPTGTRFSGEQLAVGVYWRNDWGANDLDLSGVNIGGKVGWNASYKQENELFFSGDITDAPNGAVEYLYANEGLGEPTIVYNNVYSGDPDCKFKIVVGTGSDIDKEFMMNPNNLLADIKTQSVQKQSVLGVIIPEGEQQSFVILNFGSGAARVSGSGFVATNSTKALYEQWSYPLSLAMILQELGATQVQDPQTASINLDMARLERDTFIKLFDRDNKKASHITYEA